MPSLKKKEYIAGGVVNALGNLMESSKNPTLRNIGNIASTVSRFTPAGRIAQKGYDVASNFIPGLQNNQANPQGVGPLAGLSNMANKANNVMGALGPLAKMLAKNGMAIPNAKYLPRYESGVKMMKGGSVNMPQDVATTPYGYGGYVKAEHGMKNPENVKELLTMLNQMSSERSIDPNELAKALALRAAKEAAEYASGVIDKVSAEDVRSNFPPTPLYEERMPLYKEAIKKGD